MWLYSQMIFLTLDSELFVLWSKNHDLGVWFIVKALRCDLAGSSKLTYLTDSCILKSRPAIAFRLKASSSDL